MTPFYINAFLLLAVDGTVSLLVTEEEKRRKLICILNTLQLFLFVALRSETTGNDTANYVAFFRRISQDPSLAFGHLVYEIGFRWYGYIVARITSDPRIFLAIGACAATIPFGVMIYRYSSNYVMSFFAFSTMEFMLFAMTGMRQNIAYVLTYTSFMLWLKPQKKAKIIAILLYVASGYVHRSAWGFLLLYLLAMVKDFKWKKLIYLCGLLIIIPMRAQIAAFLVQNLYTDYQVSSTGAYSRCILVAALLLVCVLYYDSISEESFWEASQNDHVSVFPIAVDALYLTLCFYILALSLSAAARQGRYFYVFAIFALPEMQNAIKTSQRQMFRLGCYLFLIILMLMLFPHNGLCTYGYTFWQ